MGLVVCKKHGTSGMVLTCSPLSEPTWNLKPISNFVKKVEKDTVDIDDKFKVEWVYCLCTNCDEKYKKKKIYEFPRYFLKPACANCFKELSNLESWK
jgi:hypothetical protein